MKIYPVPVALHGKSVVLMVNVSLGVADLRIAGSASGTAVVDVAAGVVSFNEPAIERLTKAGLDPVGFASAAGDAVWVESRAQDALAAASDLATTSPATAWGAMNAAAMQYADLAQRAQQAKERARADRVRVRIVELGGQFK